MPDRSTQVPEQVAIVVSPPRSGSKLVAALLSEVPELSVFTSTAHETSILYLLFPLKMLNPFGDDSLDHRDISEQLLLKLRIALLRRYYRPQSMRPVLVISSPTTMGFLPLLSEAFPNAKYVHLLRDPLDVIASFKQFLQETGTPLLSKRFRRLVRRDGILSALRAELGAAYHLLRWVRCPHAGYLSIRPRGFQRARRLPYLQMLCWYYTRLEEGIREVLERLPANRRFDLSYERLLLDHKNEMGRLLTFVGVVPRPEFLERTSRGIILSPLMRHKQVFSKGEIEEIESHLAVEQSRQGGV